MLVGIVGSNCPEFRAAVTAALGVLGYTTGGGRTFQVDWDAISVDTESKQVQSRVDLRLKWDINPDVTIPFDITALVRPTQIRTTLAGREAVITKDGVTIGCQSISRDRIESILEQIESLA